MEKQDKAFLLRAYNETLAKFGDSSASVHWTDETRQIERFKLLTQIGDLKSSNILDFGCGRGDLYSYLLNKGFKGTYTGYDLNPNLIELARKKYPKVQFEAGDIEKKKIKDKFNYALLSGVFYNYKMKNKTEIMQNVLKKVFSLVTKGLAFNSISSYVNFHDNHINYVRPEKIFSFCVKELSNKVTVMHHQPDYNFTCFVYKENNDKLNIG